MMLLRSLHRKLDILLKKDDGETWSKSQQAGSLSRKSKGTPPLHSVFRYGIRFFITVR